MFYFEDLNIIILPVARDSNIKIMFHQIVLLFSLPPQFIRLQKYICAESRRKMITMRPLTAITSLSLVLYC